MRKRTAFKITVAVFFALVLREMRSRLGAKRAGAFWLLFEPIAHVVAVMMVFTYLRGRQVPGLEFPVFLISGIVPFLMFKNIMLKGMEAVNANKALFSYKQIKPLDTIIARCFVEFLLMSCVYIIIMLGLLWAGFNIAMIDPLRWLTIMMLGVTFSVGMAIALCIIVDAIPELKIIIRLLFMPLYFISGVIFPVWLMPSEVIRYLSWNPLLHIIDELRQSIFLHYPKTVEINIHYPFECTIVVLFLSLFFYRIRRKNLVAL